MKHTRRVVMAAFFCFCAFGEAVAQSDFPDRTIKLITPFGAGGSTDVVARILAPFMSEELGVPFVVENRPGGVGMIGTKAVSVEPADGYTLLISTAGTMAINPHIFPENKLTPLEDFDGITLVSDAPGAVAIRSDVPVSTLEEFLVYSKTQPAGSLAYSAIVASSPQRLAFEGLLLKEGIKLRPVYYNSSGASLNALLGAEVSLSVLTAQAFAPHATSGSIKVIGVSSSERTRQFPDVPTFTELGYPDLKYGSWSGISVRAGTPEEVKDRLHKAFTKVIALPDVQTSFRNAGLIPVTTPSPEDYDDFLQDQSIYWKDILATPGMME